jgi:hypothetical protein
MEILLYESYQSIHYKIFSNFSHDTSFQIFKQEIES